MYTLPHTSINTDSMMSDSFFASLGIEGKEETFVNANVLDFRAVCFEALIVGIKSLFKYE